jgi:inhibitor of KinA sporulation pathway (predicted exonuclease)
MNYIVLDLEWNHPKIDAKDRNIALPFEIIEIGAAKVDSKTKEVLSTFSELVKPQVYKEMNEIIHEILHIEIGDLEKQDTFDNVIRRFFEWCGEDFIFCTWGNMDLTELQRNMDYYKIKGYIDGPIKYLDIQKLFAIQYLGYNSALSLETSIEYFNLEKKYEFHRAISDAMYTVEILQRLNNTTLKKYYSLDFFHNPKSKEEEILLNYDNCSKYISCEYKSKVDALEDDDVKSFNCYQCGKKAQILIPWFWSNPRLYCAIGRCNDHGLLDGKIRIKKKDCTNKIYVVKTITSTDEEGYDKIKVRQNNIREKRREKRYRKKHNED